MRLNRYLARCGVASRRAADELIRAGRVKLSGQTVTELGTQVIVGVDEVQVDGQPVDPNFQPSYILLNKPSGCLTTLRDPFQRKTVMDLVPAIPGLVPVGRLDKDTEGVLLLTNDGELAHRLAHPRYRISKTYRVAVNRPLEPPALHMLRRGVDIGEKRPAAADGLQVVHNQEVLLTLHSGRKREVKRMFEALGYRVTRLRREKFAFLELGALEPGQWRELTQEEVNELKKLVGISHGD